jgi:hypothetical protein
MSSAQVSSYNFSQSTGTYSALGGGATTAFTLADDERTGNLTIPFTFTYSGTAYTTCRITTNGFLTLGTNPSATEYFPISGTAAALNTAIAGLGADLNSTVKYQTLGSAPNRVFVAEWSDVERYDVLSTEDIEFQVKLYETSNIIEIQYGTVTTGNTTFTDGSAEVGLKSNTAVYNNVTFTNANLSGYSYTNNWNSLVNGSLQSDVVGITNAIKPATGSILRWTPSTCTQVTTAATATAITGNTATVSWTNAGTYASGYRVRWRRVEETYSASTWATPVTVAAGSSNYTITGLAPSTYYVYSIEGLCNAGSANNFSTVTTANTSNGKGLLMTSCVNVTLPHSQGFNAITIPTCWSQQFVTGSSALQFVASGTNPATTPQEGADYVYWNSYGISNGNQTRLVSAPITSTGASTVNARFYWYHDNSGYTGGGYADEGVILQYSVDGTNWTNVQTINRLLTGTNGWTLYDISLPAGAGNVPTLYVGFLFTSRLGNNCSLDNLLLYVPAACTTPTDQPSALNLSAVTATSLNGSFTAASPAPSGYIVLRSTSSAAPTLTNGNSYTIGSSYTFSGNSYTVVSNGPATSFTENSLAANTQYHYYVFSFNGSCTGAPFYFNTSPLTATTLTCTAAPATLTGTWASTISAMINFSTVPGAASYVLQYSVAGTNNWIIASPAPLSSPYTLTGLAAGTTYDIRMEGPNSNCGTLRTSSAAFTTPCAFLSLPVSQGFESGTSIPACWTQQHVTGTKNFSYGSNSTAAGNSPNPAAASGSNRLLFPSYSNNGNQTRFYSPVIITTGTASVDVQFQWYFSSSGGSGSYTTEGVQVQWSTNGTSWTNAGSLIRRYGAVEGWQRQTITLPAGAGNQPVLYVSFLLTSNAGYDSYIDDILIKATPPCNYAGTAAAASNSICGGSGATTLNATAYSVSGSGLTYQWEVSTDSTNFSNLPGEANPAAASTGTITATRFYRLRVFCTALGNSYSNIVKVAVGNYSITGTTPATRCGIGTVNLGAAASPGSTISWYTTATGGISVGSGASFTTPVISATTNYYVGANNGASLATIGATYSGAAENGNSTGSHGIVIATTSPNITIVSAQIPFTGKGTFTIQLQTTAGTVVSSVVTDTLNGGGNIAVTVPINLSIPTPGSYRLIVAAVTGTIGDLGYISTASYPYTGLAGAFTVTSGYWWGNDASDNMYLFNLVVSDVCESARSLVTATVTAPPALSVSPATATICSGSSTSINVTTALSNFISYSWLPATGVTPSGTPAGTVAALAPTTNTNYILTATSASGCVNQASVFITVNPAPPVTTSAAICSGGSATLTSASTCSNLALSGNAIAGTWNAATDPVAIQPIIFLPNSTTCEFDPDGHTMNYTKISFQVTVSGVYNFLMDDNALDGMGYIVIDPFVPGQCPGTGTWIVGDDDSGPGLMPMMDANLTAGVTYTLITTVFDYESGTSTGAYNWAITPPPGGQIATGTSGTLQWYAVSSGGTPIGTGSPFNPIGVAGSGIANNTSVGSYTFYASCSNNTTCRTPATYVIGTTGQWIGGTSTDWGNAANWCGGIPTISTDGTIVSGAPFMPVLASGTGTVRNLTVNTGATLTVNNATMQIAGTITASNAINATAGTIELAGTTAQAISGSSFNSRTIQHLKASNSVNVSSTANDSLKISGVLSFGNVNSKTFNSGDNVILVSNAAGTARVADITNNGTNSGNTFSGKFVVQRYIPARRAWRLMTAPIAAGAQTINQAWQEAVGGNWSLNPNPGYGTHVTGGPARNTTQGFDQGPLNASIYGHSGTAWNYLPANTGEPVTNRQGWMLFIRGSRAINLPLSTTSTVADITTLRPAGAIKFGTQPTIASAGGGFTVVGNPYPSPINFKTINKTGVIGGVGGNAYYLWDPNVGGTNGVGAFVTLSWNGTDYDKTIVTGTGSSNITNTGVIPSSAAFMVNLSAGGTIAIAEKDKDTVIYSQPYLFRPTGSPSSIRASLYAIDTDGSKGIVDGNLVNFSEYSHTAVENEDALKINNFQENLSVVKEGTKIAIERRNQLALKDTIFYSMWNMKRKQYELEIACTSLQLPAGAIAFVEDNYLHQKTALVNTDTTSILFTVTDDAASSAANRFMIVVEPSTVVPVTFTHLTAFEQNSDIAVEWVVQNEVNIRQYEVEKSLDGVHFTSMNHTHARGGNTTYNWLDVHAVTGDNFYRVKIVDNSGRITYSSIVKVNIGKQQPAITIYPNPVTDGIVNINFIEMPAGMYQVKIFGAAGQLVFTKQLIHAGGNAAEAIQFNRKFAQGVYQLEIQNTHTNRKVFNLVIE